jgi:hypothetical protein
MGKIRAHKGEEGEKLGYRDVKVKRTCGSKSYNTFAQSPFSFSSSRRFGGGGGLVTLLLPPDTTPPNRFGGSILVLPPLPPKAEDTAATLPARFKPPVSELALFSDVFIINTQNESIKERRERRRTDARYSLQPSPSPKSLLSLSQDPWRCSPMRASILSPR